MAESDQRSRVVKILKPLGSFAVENGICYPGTPDVHYINGWVECKWLRRWPSRAETVVKIDHYTQQQKFFAKHYIRKGGVCWFLLQVRTEWLLYRGDRATRFVNQCDREQLIANCDKYWPSGLVDKELLKCFQHPKDFGFGVSDKD